MEDIIYLREVNKEDIDLLFYWANDPDVRRNSFNSEHIPYETHVKWFENMLIDADVLQFILVKNNEPIGQIRINVDGCEAVVGYSIAKEYRGMGYGKMIINLMKEQIIKYHPEIKKLIANVKDKNEASKRSFESEGFTLKYYSYEIEL